MTQASPFTVDVEEIRQVVDDWPWISEEGRRLAHDVCLTVVAAEMFEDETDDPWSEQAQLARGRWEEAASIVDELLQHVPGPYPAVVAEAIARTEAAAERLVLSAESRG